MACYRLPKFRKSQLRKIILVLWGIDLAYLIYKIILENTSIVHDRIDATPHDIAIIILVLVAFAISCVIGHFFKVRKVISWISVVLLSTSVYLGFSYIYWLFFREPATRIVDTVLSEAGDYDYEISFESEFTQGDNVYLLSYYSKGDSVYSCYRYRKCDGATWRMRFRDNWDTTFSIGATEPEPCVLQLINDDEAAKFQSLRKRIEKYEIEYTANTYLDDSWLGITLKDYRQKKSRRLDLDLFPDEYTPRVAEIAEISRLLNSVAPPPKPELEGHCQERRKTLDALMEKYAKTHGNRGKYFLY